MSSCFVFIEPVAEGEPLFGFGVEWLTAHISGHCFWNVNNFLILLRFRTFAIRNKMIPVMNEPTRFKILTPFHRGLRQIEIYLEKQFQPLGFSVVEAHLLGYLLRFGPRTVSDLIQSLGLKNSTLTSILTRLENQKLLKRKINQIDKRSFEIILSAKGREIAAILYNISVTLEGKIIERVSTESIQTIADVVETIENVCNGKIDK